MARNTQLSNAVVNEQADALARRLDDGYFRVYTGTQPASANTAVTTQTLLVELRFADPCAPSAVDGLISFANLLPAVAIADGTATWARLLQDDGSTVVMDGSVGLADSDPNFIITQTNITTGTGVAVGGLTHDVRNSSTGI